MKVCSVESCTSSTYVKEYCSKHYQQYRRFGKITDRTKYDRNKIIIHDGYAEIELYNKDGDCIALTKIDIEDIDKVKDFKWSLDGRGYVGCRKIKEKLHRLVLNANDKDMVIDHINRNKLDNRKENLRICSQSDNTKNHSIILNSKSGVKGVQYHKSSNSWFASITSGNIIYYSRYFKNISDANYCREVMELYLHGEFSPRYDYLKEKYGNVNDETFKSVVKRTKSKITE